MLQVRFSSLDSNRLLRRHNEKNDKPSRGHGMKNIVPEKTQDQNSDDSFPCSVHDMFPYVRDFPRSLHFWGGGYAFTDEILGSHDPGRDRGLDRRGRIRSKRLKAASTGRPARLSREVLALPIGVHWSGSPLRRAVTRLWPERRSPVLGPPHRSRSEGQFERSESALGRAVEPPCR